MAFVWRVRWNQGAAGLLGGGKERTRGAARDHPPVLDQRPDHAERVCPRRNPPCWAVKRRARPCKRAVQNRVTVGNTKETLGKREGRVTAPGGPGPCSERSASPRVSSFEPRTSTVTVEPRFFTPVTFASAADSVQP
jgi:hypothetical protein